ncbi:hypothetical protein CYANOKiyG1_75580 [Okeania sp. KiyG1]|nr:hypothetical protein CYANOKiyG1_75580 [Okeania sp. KiyG1]
MKLQPKKSIYDYFSELEDPRVDRTKRHQLIDIITITICAVICGADTWVDIEAYGESKYEWLKSFLNCLMEFHLTIHLPEFLHV